MTDAEISMVDWLVSTGLEVTPAAFQSPEGIAYAELMTSYIQHGYSQQKSNEAIGYIKWGGVEDHRAVEVKKTENIEANDQYEKSRRE